MKRFILFHIYKVRFWEEIVHELTRQIIEASGLSEAAELILNPSEKEWLSINRLRALSIERPGQQALYIHTKGVTKDYHRCPVHDWRRYMAYFTIERWRDCVAKLDEGYDAVGCNWDPVGRFFSGTFFWASTDYLAKLRPIGGVHHPQAPEAWIGGRITLPDGSCMPPTLVPEKMKAYEMHSSKLNHYYHCYHRPQYEVKAEASRSPL